VSSKPQSPTGPLLIVGGYGLVGRGVARLLRERYPDLELVLGGRNPYSAGGFATSVNAQTVTIDVERDRPLDRLERLPAAILAAVSDPHDRLLVDAMRLGIPIADINRGGSSSVLDVTVLAAKERPVAAVLLAGGWMSGLAALMAAAACRNVDQPQLIDVIALISPDDRIGPNASGFTRRQVLPYQPMRGGNRQTVHPLSGIRRARCPDEQDRPAALVSTLEQITLPLTLGVETVETRIATCSPAALWALVALKRSGSLRAMDQPYLRWLHDLLLGHSGRGDLAGFTVTVRGSESAVSIDVLDIHGQAHLSALGALAASERILGLVDHRLPPGVSFPEQSARSGQDILSLTQAGIIVRQASPNAGITAHKGSSQAPVGARREGELATR
jgi:hypothetical protein